MYLKRGAKGSFDGRGLDHDTGVLGQSTRCNDDTAFATLYLVAVLPSVA